MKGSRRGVLGWRGAALFAVLIGAMGGWVGYQRWRSEPGRDGAASEATGPLATLPPGAFLALEVDLAALRAHPLTSAWLEERRELDGLGAIASLCGRDPLDRIDSLALAIPRDESTAFAVAARAGADASDLAVCAETLIRGQGGSPARDPLGSFTVVRDAAASEGARLAVRSDGALLLAEAKYLFAAIRAADGATASLHADPVHAEVRGRLGRGELRMTVVLSDEQRAVIVDELDRQGAKGSPFGALQSGGVAISLGERLDVRVVADATDAAAAVAMADQVRAELVTQAATPLATVVGYAPLLQRFDVSVDGRHVTLRAELAAEEVFSVVRRIVTLRRLMAAPATPTAPPN